MLTRGATLPRRRGLSFLAGFAGSVALVHAARLDRGAAFQAFQTGDLFTLLANDPFQRGNLAEQLSQ
jgi:hypothetical protein